ncbi:Peroxisomal Targeting Signal 1 Protein [Abortiporus biennis]
MAILATNEFLTALKSLYPRLPVVQNPWYLVAAVTFSASNRPEEVPNVFRYVLGDLKDEGNDSESNRFVVARRFRESILQSGLLCGYARSINSLIALNEITPEELREKDGVLRNVDQHLDGYTRRGKELFLSMYGDTSDSIRTLLYGTYPDLGWFCDTVGYGVVYGGTNVLSQVETSYVIATANIAMDTPRQVGWHLKNAQNGGATIDQVKAVREIAMEVSEKAGITWRDGVPEI